MTAKKQSGGKEVKQRTAKREEVEEKQGSKKKRGREEKERREEKKIKFYPSFRCLHIDFSPFCPSVPLSLPLHSSRRK